MPIPKRLPQETARVLAVLEAFLATIIWASSFIIVKIGLDYMGPLTIAGLRYFIGFLILLPFLLCRRKSASPLTRQLWIRLAAIGISAYAIGNGALFWGLKTLPATTVSFLMSLLPLIILLGGVLWLKEFPTGWQIFGVILSLAGSVLFFSAGFQAGEVSGLLIVCAGMIGFAGFGILGRDVARSQAVSTLTLTALPLAIGGVVLLLVALPLEGVPSPGLFPVLIVLWLAVVNTALAYILYNHSLKTLTALEMNVIQNLTPLGTALLAWVILAEKLTLIQILGMVIMVIGVIFVQRRTAPPESSESNSI